MTTDVRRIDFKSLQRAVPHMLTLANLVCGVVVLGLLFAGAPMWQALAVLSLALLFDLLDGRAARAFHVAGPMGAQLDSLADLVSFGVVPGALLYVWGVHGFGIVGVVACCALVCAAAWRLARFTVGAMSPAGPDHTGANEPPVFEGIPVPIPAAIIAGAAGAGLSLPPMILSVGALVLSGLMVSRIPFRSFKDKPLPMLLVPLMLLGSLAVAEMGSFFAGLGVTLSLAGLVFVAGGLLRHLSKRRSS